MERNEDIRLQEMNIIHDGLTVKPQEHLSCIYDNSLQNTI